MVLLSSDKTYLGYENKASVPENVQCWRKLGNPALTDTLVLRDIIATPRKRRTSSNTDKIQVIFNFAFGVLKKRNKLIWIAELKVVIV